MNLDGWDMVAVLPVDRVNAALAAGRGTPVEFSYREKPLVIEGRFGPWQIVSGGSVQLLHVDIPILDGRYMDARGRPPLVDLAGLTLRVEMALRLVPAPDEPGARDLCFDVLREGLDSALQPVRALALKGGEERLGAKATRVLMLALATCLSAHPDRIGHVFARARASGPLELEHHDWAWLESPTGGHLAMLGSVTPPSADMKPDHIDPRVLGNGPSRAFTLSDRAFFRRVLGPWMNTGFRPKGRFSIRAGGISLAAPLALPKRKESGFVLHPVLHRLDLHRKGAGLGLSVHCVTRIDGLTVELHTEMELVMPFTFDAATGTVSLRRDPKPKSRTWAVGSGFWGAIEAFIANLVLIFIQDSIGALANSIATMMHNMNTSKVQPITWPGQPPFQPKTAYLNDCFHFAETKPSS